MLRSLLTSKQINSRIFNSITLSLTSLHSKTRNVHISSIVFDSSDNKSTDALTVAEERNGVKTVTLNNPKKRNALSLAMIESLSKHLTDSSSLRCIVINANGPVFSSGHDLKELTSSTGKEYHEKVFTACSQLMHSIREIPVPVICQVKGVAAAAGCQLMASCDIVIATDNSQFSTPGASVGLFCSTPGIAVSRAANLKTAAYMVLTGNAITAIEALHSGLVTRVVPQDRLEDETNKTVTAILSKSKPVITLGKRFFYSQLNQNLHDAYANGSCVMIDNLCLTDAQEGISAFVGKRPPVWTHTDKKAH